MSPAAPASSTFELLRTARLRAVGTYFLRTRPLVALSGAGANAVLLFSSDAATEARVLVGGSLAVLLSFFALEAIRFRRAEASEQWLFGSLALTAAALGVGCGASGGLASPFLPLLLTPVVVGFAAFGRSARSTGLFLLGAIVLAGLGGLALAGPESAGAPIDGPHARAMTLVSAVVALVLMRLGVAELAESYVGTGRALDRLRLEVLDEALRRARDAEALGAKVAHEIRNPLTSIKGLGQLVRAELTDPRALRRLDVLLAEVERVDALASGYLSLARPLHDLLPEELDAVALVDDVLALLEARAAAAGVRLVRRGATHAPLRADPRRLREALLNLAENALRAMPRGGTLCVTLDAQGASVRVVVADDGEGMSLERLAALGRPFEPGREDGTGLGVAIARGAAVQHGGALRFESEVGRGTRAILELPLTPGAGLGATEAP